MAVPQASTQSKSVVPRTASQRKASPKKIISEVLYNLGLLLTLFFVAFPILWLVLTAFKDPIDVYSSNLLFTPTLANFQEIFKVPLSLGPKLLNTIIISAAVLVIAIPLAVMGAYALSRYHFRSGNAIFVGILATQFIPPVVVVIPFFVLFRQLGLVDTLLALVIVDLAIVLPYSIWLMKGFVDALPNEIEQAARIDGASEADVLRYIVTPLVMPGVIVASVFAFIAVWNEFLFSFALTRSNAVTLMIGLLSTAGVRGIMWEQMAAAAILVMIPIFVLSVWIREYFVQGLTLGAVK
jgi:multiple sugar transport system permease protein